MPVSVTGVTLNKTSDVLNIGGTDQLVATVAPLNATNKSVTWASNNVSVATVNSSGVITGIMPGVTTITVTTADGSFTASCNVTVNQILTLAQIENLFQSITVGLTGLDSNTGVRISWPTDGAPGWPLAQDVVFIRVSAGADQVIQTRDTLYQASPDNINVPTTISYIRVHTVSWVIYGPNAYENGDLIRDGLGSESTKALLSACNLAQVWTRGPVFRVPELFNGQWWNRCDYENEFNEQVKRYNTVSLIGSASVIINANGDEEVI
jgi:hypothetical protein